MNSAPLTSYKLQDIHFALKPAISEIQKATADFLKLTPRQNKNKLRGN